jgi:hypothetical protein
MDIHRFITIFLPPACKVLLIILYEFISLIIFSLLINTDINVNGILYNLKFLCTIYNKPFYIFLYKIGLMMAVITETCS